MLPNGLDWFHVLFGASIVGAVAVSINIRLGCKEVGDIVAATRAKAIIYDGSALNGGCLATLTQIPATALATVGTVFDCDPAEGDEPIAGIAVVNLRSAIARVRGDTATPIYSPAPGQDDAFLILATSGTTGQSKFVLHEQARIVRHSRDAAIATGATKAGGVTLATMPFSGAYGFTLVMSAIAGRQTVVVAQAFDPIESGALIRRHDVTHMGGTNDMIYRMLQAADGAVPFPTLRSFFHANFTPSLTEMPPEAERRGVQIRGGYGASELFGLFTVQPHDADLDARAQAGGVPVSEGATFRIVDPDTGDVVPDGDIGEIEVLAPNGMTGYLDNPAANAATITPDGYIKTGDLGYRLADGRLQFETRRNDVLRIGGYLVSPAEIEERILAMPGVTACQVVAVQQGVRVRPVAFVIGDSTVPTEDAIIQSCQAQLAKYKVPIRVFKIDSFPTVNGPNGLKVRRNDLRDLAMTLI